jgi:hypothetical protein
MVPPLSPLRASATLHTDSLHGAGTRLMIAYEKRLDSDLDWALQEGGMHFSGGSEVQKTLGRIARRLEEIGVPYAIVGAMAMFAHGVRRFTEDVDILVTRQGLATIHDHLAELGCVLQAGSTTTLRDAETGVRIDFLLTGAFPGDATPKPIAFPDPAAVSVEIDGIRFLRLSSLLEFELAAGMHLGRLKFLGDAQRILETLDLPEDFAAQLDPFVQEKYKELWTVVHSNPP